MCLHGWGKYIWIVYIIHTTNCNINNEIVRTYRLIIVWGWGIYKRKQNLLLTHNYKSYLLIIAMVMKIIRI